MSSADLDDADVEAVLGVLRSGRLALGPRAVEFERMMAEYVGVRHAVAVNSGTSALHLIVRALGLGPGDEVLVPSFTFAASVNAILYERAAPVFVDIEPETYNLSVHDLRRKITPRTRAVMAVDVFGHPAEWDELTRLAREHGLKVIDDSCEALGAEYRGRKVGQFGDAAAFAFYPNKQITTGEGGIIVTDSDEVAALCRSMCNQGRGEMGSWLEHDRLGYNYRLDEMSAALGCSQLARVEELLGRREAVARAYTERLGDSRLLRPQVVLPHVRMSWFVYVVTLAEGIARDAVIRELEAAGVPARAYFSPVHLQKYIRERPGLRAEGLAVTESVAARTVALPFHNLLTAAQIDYVVARLLEAAERLASR
ncbi:MAG: DegT/DnrJ/EryC1/StrS family aminotransferase [Pyrinomonadaceae bacterium]